MVQTSAGTPTERVARLIDELAPVYDQTGVDFFVPIADRLVERLEADTGDRAVDLGCGRGAVAFRLAETVGSEGSVTAVDISPVWWSSPARRRYDGRFRTSAPRSWTPRPPRCPRPASTSWPRRSCCSSCPTRRRR